jgi:2'-5' RNA ligase
MQIYEQLWNEAMPAFKRGEPLMDHHLPDKTKDRRRGVSLAFWLPPSLQARIKLFLDQLAADFPGQYFYQPEELHVTVLTLISGSEFRRQEIADVPAFRAILREILSRHHSFKLAFRGVTASPNAVLIQGFPLDEGLAKIREAIRRGFAQKGFANRLDRRYPNSAAHVTAMRFCKPEADWKRLAARLKENRQTHFGGIEVNALQLIWGDWYASANTVRMLEEHRLPDSICAADVS